MLGGSRVKYEYFNIPFMANNSAINLFGFKFFERSFYYRPWAKLIEQRIHEELHSWDAEDMGGWIRFYSVWFKGLFSGIKGGESISESYHNIVLEETVYKSAELMAYDFLENYISWSFKSYMEMKRREFTKADIANNQS